jgi:hypothetical protein
MLPADYATWDIGDCFMLFRHQRKFPYGTGWPSVAFVALKTADKAKLKIDKLSLRQLYLPFSLNLMERFSEIIL